MPLLSIT